MTTTSKRAPKTPAGDTEGDAPDDVTSLPPGDADESHDDDASDDAKKPAKKSKADDKADDKPKQQKTAPQPEPGFFESIKRFWWDEEIR